MIVICSWLSVCLYENSSISELSRMIKNMVNNRDSPFCPLDIMSLLVNTTFCVACKAEARHMYCFSGVVVVVGGGVVNFLCLGHFLRSYKG